MIEESLNQKKKRLDVIYGNIEKKKEKIEEDGDETLIVDITDDMYCGSLSNEVVQEFTCMLCYGIVMDPIKCKTCNNMVCKKCVN